MRAKVKEKTLIWLACVSVYSRFVGSRGFVFANSVYNGTLNPIDPDVCLTQDITFTCTLRSPPVSANSIGFAVKNESTNTEYVAVENKEINIISETVSEFTIYNINASPNSYIYVRCYYWETQGDLNDTLKIDETSTATVFSMPKKIEKIDCIVENYLRSMTCTWDYGTSGKPNNVWFKWRIPQLSAAWNNCSGLNIEHGYCFWKSSREGDFTMKLIEINITVGKLCGVEIPSNFTIDTSKIVKPDPVVGLQAIVLNSTCIEVSWQTNNSHTQYPKGHRLVVSSKWRDEQTYKFNTTADFDHLGLAHERVVCQLRPYTEYKFNVSIQPTGDQVGFYSDPRVTTAKTFSDLPDASPEVTKGGYKWYPRECEGNNLRRHVCIFWKQIKTVDRNGPMKGLRGLFTAKDNPNSFIEEDWAEDLTYGCSSLMCNTSYTFTIQARNVNGTSKYNSRLKISSAFSGIPQPHLIVESANTSDVYVNWTFPEDSNLEKFIVAWCRQRNGDCDNIHEVYWAYYPADAREAILAINSSNYAQDFMYGVGAVTKQDSSGLEWQDCVYLKNRAPKNPPKYVVVSEGSEDNTLVVTWDKLTCKSDEPYIAMYNVQFNKLNDANKKALNVSSSGEARVVLADLEEEQTYTVTVRGITKDGQYGPKSLPKTGTPVNKSLKPGQIGGIVMGVLVVVLFAGVGCFCILRNCKRKAKMKFEKDRKITIPGNDLKPNIPETIERKNSDDSGIYQVTPQPDKFEGPPKFDNRVMRTLPGHVYATEEGTTIDSYFVPRQRECTAGMVLKGNIMPSSEPFVKREVSKADEDETSVKLRGKNISKDSGMSDAYSKTTAHEFEENALRQSDDGADRNKIKYVSSNKELPEKSYNTYIVTNESLSLNKTEKSAKIPTPEAFTEHSDSDFSLSERENELPFDNGVEIPPGYTRAQWPFKSDAQNINFPSHASNLHPESEHPEKTDIPALTKIP